ncbi:hypothetical protein B0H13DRAFT_2341221 [Mycena leptocephala]|nr:hypothetical protein B0H13DRAFT_2341221 [Mycena leptocephala]
MTRRRKAVPLPIEKKVRMYPWDQVPCLSPSITLHTGHPTLSDNKQELYNWFSPNPADCTRCLKPLIRHRTIPHATFTIFVSCQHGEGPDAAQNLYPNKAVAAVMPDPYRRFTCLGNLMVVKHSLSASDASLPSNRDLPIVDVVPADFPFVDELVVRWCYYLAQQERVPAS